MTKKRKSSTKQVDKAIDEARGFEQLEIREFAKVDGLTAADNIDKSSKAQILAELADKNGVSPRHLTALQPVLAKAGIVDVSPETVKQATVLFRDAIDQTLRRGVKINQQRRPALAVAVLDVPVATEPTLESKLDRAAKPAKQAASKSGKTGKARKGLAEIFGNPVTAILRWMGKDGWTFDEAVTACATLGAAKVAENTVKWQLRDKGRTRPLPELTAAEVKKLRSARN